MPGMTTLGCVACCGLRRWLQVSWTFWPPYLRGESQRWLNRRLDVPQSFFWKQIWGIASPPWPGIEPTSQPSQWVIVRTELRSSGDQANKLCKWTSRIVMVPYQRGSCRLLFLLCRLRIPYILFVVILYRLSSLLNRGLILTIIWHGV